MTTATFYTIVTDGSGAAIPGATVQLREEATGAPREQTCGDDGECGFTFLPPGSYTVTIAAPGFKTLVAARLPLEAAQNVRRTFSLDVGNVVEKISVSAALPLINTVSAEQLEQLGSSAIRELPAARRRASELFQIGTATSRIGGTQNTSGSFELNGLGRGASSITMDGIQASAHPGTPQGGMRGGFNYIEVTSIEAIEQVDVAKGALSAEYGRAMSGNLNVVTKSGTNNWHGSLFHNFNVEELNARPFFLATNPPLTFNQFGGSLGGPVVRDRVFLFGVYEGYRERRFTTVNGEVPSVRLRDAMLARFPDYKLALDEFFVPNQPLTTPLAPTGRYIGAGSVKSNTNHFVIKPDVWIASALRLSSTWVRDRPDYYQARGPGRNIARTFTGTLDRFNVTLTEIKPRWTGETRFGWSQVDNSRDDRFFDVKDPGKPETKLGGRRVPGLFAFGFSQGGETNFIGDAPHWSFEQKITMLLGKHSLKFGGLLSRRQLGQANIENPNFFYNTEAELIANTPVRTRFTFGFDPWIGRQLDFGFFVQDDWRVNRKLVLNLGLRYDYFDNMTVEGVNGPWPKLVNTSFTDFSRFILGEFRPYDNAYDKDPASFGRRVGFAYNPDGAAKTVVRGGFGIMHSPVNVSVFEQTPINGLDEPFRVDLSQAETERLQIRFPYYNEDVLPLVRGGTAGRAFQLVDPSINTPYALNYTLGIQRALSGALMLETSYVGTRGVKFVLPRIYNTADPVSGIRPNPALGESRYWDNSDSSVYHSWQTSVRKRMSRGLMINAHYTWGKTLAYMYGDLTYAIPTFIQEFFDVRSNRGRTPGDIQHSFVSSFLYEVPGLANANRVVKTLFGGWQSSGIVRAQTGNPLTVTQASARAFGRPDIVDPGRTILDSGLQYLDPSAFALVPVSAVSRQQIRPGSAGNGAIEGPGSWNVDLSLGKNFQLNERLRFQFRADLINGFNHANLTSIETSINSGRFGQRIGATEPRAIQFHLRLAF